MDIGGGAIVILAHERAPGEALPRLAAEIGDEGAAEVYRCLLADTVARVQRVPRMTRYVAVAGSAPAASSILGLPEDVPSFEVIGDSQGAQLSHVFGTCLERGHDRVIAVSAQSPNVPLKAVREAAEHLRFLEVVFGPREGRGFYLAGSRGRFPELFSEVDWEEADAEEAADAARHCGLEYAILDQWYTVETLTDLQLLAQFIEFDVSEDNPCPCTAAWLKRNL